MSASRSALDSLVFKNDLYIKTLLEHAKSYVSKPRKEDNELVAPWKVFLKCVSAYTLGLALG